MALCATISQTNPSWPHNGQHRFVLVCGGERRSYAIQPFVHHLHIHVLRLRVEESHVLPNRQPDLMYEIVLSFCSHLSHASYPYPVSPILPFSLISSLPRIPLLILRAYPLHSEHQQSADTLPRIAEVA